MGIKRIVRAGTRQQVELPADSGHLRVSFAGTCMGKVQGLPQFCDHPVGGSLGYPGDNLEFWTSNLEVNDRLETDDRHVWQVTEATYWPGVSAGQPGPDEYAFAAKLVK